MPTFVAFHPWTTLRGYCELLDTIAALDLVDHVAPIQLAIRLLIPSGSRLLELDDDAAVRRRVRPADADLPLDASRPARRRAAGGGARRSSAARLASDRREVFEAISALAHERAGLPRAAARRRTRLAPTVPYLTSRGIAARSRIRSS